MCGERSDSDRGKGTLDPFAWPGTSSCGLLCAYPEVCLSPGRCSEWIHSLLPCSVSILCSGLAVIHFDPHTKRFALIYYVNVL